MILDYIVQYTGFVVGFVIYVVFGVFIWYLCNLGKNVSNTISRLAIISIFSYGLCPIGTGIYFFTTIMNNEMLSATFNFLVQVCLHILYWLISYAN